MAADEAEQAERWHRRTYDLFIGLMKYGAILSFIVAFIVVLIIRN